MGPISSSVLPSSQPRRDPSQSATEEYDRDERLTTSNTITISHDALTMCIFKPIFAKPIGIINMNTSLNLSVSDPRVGRIGTYAKAFGMKDETTSPLAHLGS
jgi:hypothetical protein